jgi:hypothetical protein
VSTALSLRRPWNALLLVTLLTVAAPASASAHLRSGAIATDYRANVRPPPRLRSALAIQVYESDRALHLSARAHHTLVVEGYVGEPLLRIDAAGVAVNVASTTAAGAGLLKKNEHVSGPGPEWRLRSTRRDVVWHDPAPRGSRPASRAAPGACRSLWTERVRGSWARSGACAARHLCHGLRSPWCSCSRHPCSRSRGVGCRSGKPPSPSRCLPRRPRS